MPRMLRQFAQPLTLLLLTSFFVSAVMASTESNVMSSLSADLLSRYQDSIDDLSRELTAAKKHRTAVIGRMDDISHQMTDVDTRVSHVIDQRPSLRDGIAEVDGRIERLSEQIGDADKTLQFLAIQLQNLPVASLWEDALGKSTDKRRERAIREYQHFKTEALLSELEQQQQELIASRGSLFDSFVDIKGFVENLSGEQRVLKEKKKELERQFVDLSAEIVQKQDRRGHLQLRMDTLLQNPEQALFSGALGQLPQPTDGDLRHAYAEPKAQGLLKWEGIVISAPLGQEVTAVFDGSVVFADHMQGLGNVAIVDHGNGFMSLYGMTDFLLVEPGQTVLEGDTIGTVGTVAGDDQSGLYFEIRRDADTLNPVEWLKSHSFSPVPGS